VQKAKAGGLKEVKDGCCAEETKDRRLENGGRQKQEKKSDGRSAAAQA